MNCAFQSKLANVLSCLKQTLLSCIRIGIIVCQAKKALSEARARTQLLGRSYDDIVSASATIKHLKNVLFYL